MNELGPVTGTEVAEVIEYARSLAAPRPPTPPAETCGSCGTVYDDWAWDEQDQDWENDFEWWWHKVSGHEFLCSRRCWLAVHRAHCGGDGPCIENENAGVSTNG